MPTFNNYTFSNVTYTITEGDSISLETGGTAVITISPLSGYILDVADFSLDPSFSNSYVDSVVFAQDGANVTATVNFTAGTVMPSDNLQIPLCIIGAGVIQLITINGKYSSIVSSNVAPSSETDVVYSNSGALGESELLFSKTYTADSGYYFSNIPTAQILTGNQSNYNIAQTPTYNIDGQLTALQFDVNYIYPNNSVTGDVIKFVASAEEIYVPIQEITEWTINNSLISINGETRTLYVYGGAGAEYSITLTDGTTATDIAINAIMSNAGLDSYIIDFPANSYSSTITWTFTISGDISGSLNTSIVLTQATEVDGIFLPKSSSIFGGGYSIINTGQTYARLSSSLAEVEIEWLITASNDAVINLSNISVNQVQWENQGSIVGEVTSASSGIATMTSTTGLLPGMRFSSDEGTSFLNYEIVSVDSATQITYTPTDLTITESTNIDFTNNNGFTFDQSGLVAQYANTNHTAVTITGTIIIEIFGDETTTFELDLEQFLSIISIINCSSTTTSGGEGITDLSIQLDPAGGLITFLVYAGIVVDKFEILHGDGSGVKVATSSITASGNSGPFDNTFGTESTNILPTTSQSDVIDQFIGTNKGTMPTRQTEFNADTGYTISNMAVSGTTYQQIIWWEYTASDYTTNNLATLRITGIDGTLWKVLRVCCPDAVCV